MILTDPERQLPCGRAEVDGGPLDFRAGRELAASEIDCPFTGLQRDWEGRATARLTGSDGATVELWVDDAYEFLEVFTGDTLAPERRRTGLGLEPMTCAAGRVPQRRGADPPGARREHGGHLGRAPRRLSAAAW